MLTNILDPDFTSCAGIDVLVCVPFGPKADQVIQILKSLKCRPYLAVSPEDALRKLRFNAFQVILITSGYSSEVSKDLMEKPMSSRRHFFYIYVDSEAETGNPFQAFALSANLVLNMNELDILKERLEPALMDYNKLYRVYYNVSKTQEEQSH
ncbi:MAG: hypothetical protein AABZ60_14290 [Planctomycetota bacterium]